MFVKRHIKLIDIDAVKFKKIMKKVEHSRAGIKLQSLCSQGQCIYHHATLPYIYIKTHDSESRGQEEAGRTR